jgi:hypothetical protein
METFNNDSEYNNYSGFKTYNPSELSTIYFDNILKTLEIETRVNEFNKKFRYPFRDSLSFQLGRSMVKHCSPTDLIEWKISIKEREITNNRDNDKTTIETRSIVTDFIKAKSHIAMDRIVFYRDHEFDGKIFNNVRVLDYSVVITPEQFPNYKSILFNDKNREIIMHYYFEFIYWFPVTMAEFEKIFFLFLTFLAEDQYPHGSHMNDSRRYIDDINEIVKMRYIDMEDSFILSFLYILSIDEQLHKKSETIYAEIKRNYDMMIDQFENMAS